MEIKIRNATLSDLPSILNIAKSLGRHTSADEVRTILQVDSESIFVAESIPDGKLMGICCGIRYTPELGFISFYTVLEEYRGRGIGLKLWNTAKKHLGERNIGLYAEPNYLKMYQEDFCHIEDYEILFYESFGGPFPTNATSSSCIEVATYLEGNLISFRKISHNDCSLADKEEYYKGSREKDGNPAIFDSEVTCKEDIRAENAEHDEKYSFIVDKCNTHKSFETKHVGESVPLSVNTEDNLLQMVYNRETKSNVELTNNCKAFLFNSINLYVQDNSKAEDILSRVLTFDKMLHNRDRSSVVRQTFSSSSCCSKVAIVEGKVVGYACLRKVVTKDWKIAPFYANTEDIAELLLFELLQGFDFSQAQKGLTIYFPNKNIACKKLLEKFGFRSATTRLSTMFTKYCPRINTSKVYSHHSLFSYE